MKIGDIYKHQITYRGINEGQSDHTIVYTDKVIMFDHQEVFNLPVDDDNNLMERKRKTLTYSRSEREIFERTSNFIEPSNLSEDEVSVHRPDLPLRLNCFSNIFWSHKPFQSIDEFSAFLSSKGIDANQLERLDCNKVVIVPQSQQQSSKKPVLFENQKGYFDGLDLLYSCFNIESSYVNSEKQYFSRFRLIPEGREEKRLSGIGLYRLGIKANVPSYYLGGVISQLELEGDESYIRMVHFWTSHSSLDLSNIVNAWVNYR